MRHKARGGHNQEDAKAKQERRPHGFDFDLLMD
jgi:hypothetical protein